jgi:hypothetical protein
VQDIATSGNVINEETLLSPTLLLTAEAKIMFDHLPKQTLTRSEQLGEWLPQYARLMHELQN